MIDSQELLRRLLKYVVIGFAVSISAFYIPKMGKMRLEEVAILGLVAAATFAVLDVMAPSLSGAARTGAGFGIGANLVGFPHA